MLKPGTRVKVYLERKGRTGDAIEATAITTGEGVKTFGRTDYPVQLESIEARHFRVSDPEVGDNS